MSTATVASLVESLHELGLLEREQLQKVEQLQNRALDPRELAKALVRKGWLSRHQATKVFRGEGGELVQGPYLIIEPLGEGGMGQVFKARHRKLGHVVALKLIRRERARDPKALRRFERETQAVAQLSHPNIIQAYDAGELKHGFFLAMEYAPGNDLARLLKDQARLPIHVACEYIRQTALGLQHAHERGLVHRDIKPSNLLVCGRPSATGDRTDSGSGPIADGRQPKAIVKILDLGLARVERSASGDALSQVTCENLVIGTPDYIAPEQALRPHDVDWRADIYSLGCTLYHLLTGRIPFPAGTVMEKLLKHRSELAEPIGTLRPEAPPALSVLVRQMMAKKPEDRPASAAAIAAALAPFCTEVLVAAANNEAPALVDPLAPTMVIPRPTEPPSASVTDPSAPTEDSPFGDTPTALRNLTGRPQRGIGSWLFMGLVSLVLTGTLISILLAVAGKASNFPGGDRAEARPPNATALASTPRATPVMIAANQPWQDTLIDVNAGERLTIRARGRWQRASAAQTCSADGDRTATWEDAVTPSAPMMSLIARIGNAENIIACGQNTAFTPPLSGRLFVQANDLELRDNLGSLTLEIDGGKSALAAAGSPPLLPVQVLERDWQTLAARLTAARDDLSRLTPDLQAFRQKYPGTPQAMRATTALQRLSSALDRQPVRQAFRRVEGDPIDVVIAVGDPDSILRKPKQAVAISADGKLLAAGVDGFGIRLWDLEQSPPRELTTLKGHSDAVRVLAFAPFDQRLASVAYGLDRTVRLWDTAAGEEVLKVGGQKATASVPGTSSPDGKHFLTGSDQGLTLWSMEGNAVRHFTNHDIGLVNCIAYTPDGRRAVSAGDDRKLRVWDIDKGEQLREVETPDKAIGSLVVTADGRRMISGSEDGIRLWDLDRGTELQRLDFPQGVAGLSLSPDGQLLAAAGNEGAVVLWELPAGKPLRNSRIPGSLGGVAFAPDGRHLALATRHGKTLVIRLTR